MMDVRKSAGTVKGFLAFLMLAITVATNAAAQESHGSFECASHTVAIDHLPGARFVTILGPQTGVQKIFERDFSDFGPKYPIRSVHFLIGFTPEPARYQSVPSGKMHLFARLRTDAAEQWFQVADVDTQSGGPHSWYDESSFADLLNVWSMPAEKDENLDSPDDPLVSQSGRPQAHIQQAENHEPVFLLKFIRLAAAGGHGDVETEQAIVLDFRTQPFQAAAAVGCVKNDFASEQHEDEWISCEWNHPRQDFICKTNSYYDHDWSFLLIEGRRLSTKPAHD